MNDLTENREKCCLALSALGKLFSEGIFNKDEVEKMAAKICKKYGFKKDSIIVSNELITTLINESMYVKDDTISNGD